MAGLWENYYRTQESILTSPTLLASVLEKLPPEIRGQYDPARGGVQALLAQVDLEKVRTSFILRVGIVDPDPRKATQILNVLVSVYLEDASRRLRTLKSGAAEALSKEALPSILSTVEQADKALQEFQGEAGFIDFEEHYQSLVEARRKVSARLVELRLQRARVSAESEALAGYGSDGLKGMFNRAFHVTRALEVMVNQKVQLEADLARERRFLKDKHPRVLEMEEALRLVHERIRDSIQGTLLALKSELQAVEFEERTLAADLEGVEKALTDSGRKLTTYRRLQGEIAASKELYSQYLKKHGETTATSGTGLGSVRVIDHATVPVEPFKPRVAMNLGLSMMAGLLLGLLAMAVTEQLDDRLVAAAELEAFVGLDALSVIPKLSGAGPESPVLLGDASGLDEFESFRGLRAEVVTRLEKVEGAKVLAVLSPSPGEGKSTVAINLARVLAMEGRRVLVFDADLRRPSARKALGIPSGPGLEEVLKGEATLEKAVQPSSVPMVDVLGAREGTSGAAELAGSPRFDAALQAARERYDFVIIDSAPVNVVSESALVARRADAAVLVTRHGRTGRGSALAARKRLEGMGIRLLGAVLNCASSRAHGYGYGYYSYGYYGSSRA
jgi:capsular exopolysaccharide synthesis family protein